MPKIELHNVTKEFGKIRALDHASLVVEDGEYICVLGPTGSGKTTLLRVIAGLISPTEGEISFDSMVMNTVPPEGRDAVYVPQMYALFPHMTVRQNLMFGPLAKGFDIESATRRCKDILKMVRLEGWKDSFPNELSGGMQQRVALARGLAGGAKILLLDEPLGALDARLRVELRYRLKELVKSMKLTAIHVTHDQEEAMTVADRIVVLRNGRIQQYDSPLNIYSKPSSIFVANFVGEANFFEGLVRWRRGAEAVVELSKGFRINVQNYFPTGEERVVVAVRLERSHIRKHIVWDGNVLPGELTAIRFLGSHIKYDVELENGDRALSKIPTYMRLPETRVKDKVYVSFHPEDCAVYPYPSQGLLHELEVI